jgi:hypothetical protein
VTTTSSEACTYRKRLYTRFKGQRTGVVWTITLEGDGNGAPHPDASAYAGKFVDKYEHQVVKGGVGHNLPQEAPAAFAQAIMDVDRYSHSSHNPGGIHEQHRNQ